MKNFLRFANIIGKLKKIKRAGGEKSILIQDLKQSTWNHRIKILFWQKSTYVFYIVFISLIILASSIYFFNLTSFALSVKGFTLVDGIENYPSEILAHRFNCTTEGVYFLCGLDITLFLALLMFIEIYAARKVILFRKQFNKLTLFLYLVVMQLFIITTFFVLGYTPDLVVANLTRKARIEIHQSINSLNALNEVDKKNIETSIEQISSRVVSSSLEDFTLVESNPHKGAVLSYLKIPKKGKDTLYRSIIIPYELSYSDTIKNAKLSFDFLLFPDNTLVINKADKKSVERLVPVIANRMIGLEFKKLPKSPNILFLKEEEYNVHQKKQEEEIKKQHEEYITYMESYIKESDGIIQTNQDIINSYPSDKLNHQKVYDDYIVSWGGWYAACKRDFGDHPDCEDGKNKIEQNIDILKHNIQTIEDDRNQAEQNAKLQTAYKDGAIEDLTTAKQNYQNFLKDPITAEFQDGVFISPDKIYIKFHEKKDRAFSSYLDIAIHEYLHFYSYVPEKVLDAFIEEGLTDYFKLDIGSKSIESDYLSPAYPYEVEIANELVKRFSKEKLAQIYFDKNQIELERLFAEQPKALDYEAFILNGKSLYYAGLKDEDSKRNYLNQVKLILQKKGN